MHAASDSLSADLGCYFILLIIVMSPFHNDIARLQMTTIEVGEESQKGRWHAADGCELPGSSNIRNLGPAIRKREPPRKSQGLRCVSYAALGNSES
jgi:hypothetical protein